MCIVFSTFIIRNSDNLVLCTVSFRLHTQNIPFAYLMYDIVIKLYNIN